MAGKTTIPEYNWQELYPHTKTLSSSQVLLYAENPSRFYTEYVLGVRQPPSVAMQVGSIFSALHQDRQFPYKEALAEIAAPKHIAALFEQVIINFPTIPAEVVQIASHDGWKFRATLDGYVKDDWTIIENKTGQTVWDQERVNFNQQMTFQAWVHWKKYKIIPKKILLNWVNTKSRAPQALMTFKTSRTVKGLRMFENTINLVLEGIQTENWTRPIYEY